MGSQNAPGTVNFCQPTCLSSLISRHNCIKRSGGGMEWEAGTFVVWSLSCAWLFVTPWTTACQALLPSTVSQNLLKFMSIESAMLSDHLILWHNLLSLPSAFLVIRVFCNDSALCLRWPKYWSFSFSISPSHEYSVLISFKMSWFDLLAIQDSQESSPAPQFESINFLLVSMPTLTSIPNYWENQSCDDADLCCQSDVLLSFSHKSWCVARLIWPQASVLFDSLQVHFLAFGT